MSKKESYKRTLEKLSRCSGDCKHCKKCHIYISGLCYAFGCDSLPASEFGAISNSMRNLKKECIEQMEFELSIIALHEK